MQMTRFTWGMISTLLGSGWLLAQLATSFPLIRGGCIFLLIGGFIAIAVDAAIEKAKIDAEGGYVELLAVITPHIAYSVGLLFMILIGVFVGWGW